MSTMSVITLRQVIKDVPKRWRGQYGDGRYGRDKLEILKRLDALDAENCSADDINAAIGNSSWTNLQCDSCQEQKERIIRIGDDPDYEARWQDLCVDCLNKAVAMLAKETP
jgi:hypothetical protein